MTSASFAPYGEVFAGPHLREERAMLPSGFSHEGRVTLSVISQPSEGTTFTRMERHFAITQAFVQLAGAPCVVCVAPPGDLSNPASVPEPESVRGFLIDPAQGWMFHRGTWHSLERFVLAPSGASFVIVNAAPNPTQIVDFATGAVQMYDDLDVTAPRQLPDMAHRGILFALPL
jgi:ureidoglycolate hydrolase